MTGSELNSKAKGIAVVSYCAYVNYWADEESKTVEVALACQVIDYGNGTVKEQVYAVGSQVNEFNKVLVKRGTEIAGSTFECFKLIYETKKNIEDAVDYAEETVVEGAVEVGE